MPSDYAVTNLEDLEPNGVEGSLDGRFTRTALESAELGVTRWRFAPNFRTPVGHRHGVQEEVYAVIAGSGRMKLGDDVIDLTHWNVVRVAPELWRATEAGPDGLEVIVTGSKRPEDGDSETAADFWPEDAG